MNLLPAKTLSFFQKFPLGLPVNLGSVPCHIAAQKITSFMDDDEDANTVPETMALNFYGLNHAAALIQQHYDPDEELPDDAWELMVNYHRLSSQAAVRAGYYLLLICIREARHTKAGAVDDKVVQEAGGAVKDFIRGLPSDSHAAYNRFLKSPPPAALGALVRGLNTMFWQGSFTGGYGGPAWGAVCNCLESWVKGDFSPEMMLDTVWTLSHNNGPIFNKGMLFSHYSDYLPTLLDVQRSGQIPELILQENSPVSGYYTTLMKTLMGNLRKLFPKEIGNYVDWFKVEGLGAIGSYGSEQHAQFKLHGHSEWQLKYQAEKIKVEKAAAEKAQAEKAEFEKNHFTIMPGMHVKKVNVPREDAA